MKNQSKTQPEQTEQPSAPEVKLKFKRGPSRRQNQNRSGPPYVTEEGLVLVDRRSEKDRRGDS
ncbi:MAG TPA: hypothetical protein VM532_10800 [Burkholderiales bacterium]|nr:hypothetical protein [Burkholderiales bacterium]